MHTNKDKCIFECLVVQNILLLVYSNTEYCNISALLQEKALHFGNQKYLPNIKVIINVFTSCVALYSVCSTRLQ